MTVRVDSEILEQAQFEEVIKYLINKHDGRWHQTLANYYEGKHEILNRQMVDGTKPNNRLVINLPGYIIDTITGYFMGSPVVYTGDEAYIEALTEVFESNDEQDHNSELAKEQGVKGAGYELLYTDAEANIKFVEVPRENMIYVESADVESTPLMAIRIYKVENIDGTEKEYYDVYTDSEVIVYEMINDNRQRGLVERDRWEHYFGEVPVVQYKNNKELLGDFESVLTLIDAYNIAQSDSINNLEYFADAYLKMTGAGLDSEQVKTMKENRVIILPDKEADVSWLIKNVDETSVESIKDRLREDIHTISKVPDLTADEFGTALSGVAISYRLYNLEALCATKERKFKKGLQRRIKLITNILNKQGKQWDYKDIEIKFSRAMPKNVKEIAEVIGLLDGRVDRETLLSWLPNIDDPALILEKLEEEKEQSIDLSQYMTEDDEEAEV